MKALVKVFEVLAVVGTVAFAAALFLNEPERLEAAAPTTATTAPGGEGGEGGEGEGGEGEEEPPPPPQIDAAALYTDRCAACHGRDGGGGRGPQLSDGVAAARFPDIEDQIAIVTEGDGGMPSFGDRLTPNEIRAVVEFTRTL